MAETKRIAQAVEESSREIQTLGIMETQEVKAVEYDVFLRDAEMLKSLSGTSSNFKRKVTTELKKYNRSVDGQVGSKSLPETAEITGYDTFKVIQPPHNLEELTQVYHVAGPHYAAVNAKVANIAGLGYNLVESRKTKRALEQASEKPAALAKARKKLAEHKDEVEDWLESLNDEMTVNEILQMVWLDYEVTGNGYIEISRNKDGSIGYVGHIPSHTLRVRRERDGYIQISANKVRFFRNFGEEVENPVGGDADPNELIHIKKYSPAGGGYYGVPDIVAAEQAVAGNEFSSRFNLEYFEYKAVPRHVITLKGANLSTHAQSELLTFFETGLRGKNHRSLFVPLPSDEGNNKVEFKIDAIEAGTQDSSFINYRKANLAEMLMVHRVPLSKVSTAEGASLAIARDADKTFKEQVCAPEQDKLAKKFNRIIKEFTDAYEFKLNEMTLTDANTQSQIDERHVKNGIKTANEIRTRDGYASIDGGDERVDLNAKDKLQAQANEATAAGNRERDAQRSAGQTDGAGEARNPKGEGRTTA